MSNVRLIARLDIKGPNLIKGVHLEGLRVVGDPQVYAKRYYASGVDELLYIDIVASLYGRNNLVDIVKRTASEIFVPLTVGGGIRSVEDVTTMLRAGADKVAINTAVTRNPQLIRQVSERFGSQCMVLNIEAKRVAEGHWEVMTENGREHSGLDAVEWARQGVELGAGELLVTSIDQEGTRKGFDVELVRAISSSVSVPVIASGGLGTIQHMLDVVRIGKADAVAIADALHYDRIPYRELQEAARRHGLSVRYV